MEKYILYSGRIDKIERETKTLYITEWGDRYNIRRSRPVWFKFYWNCPDELKVINEEDKIRIEKIWLQRKTREEQANFIYNNIIKEKSFEKVNEIYELLTK